MGSALVDGDCELWGLRKLGWYGRAWRRRKSSLDDLALTRAERQGEYGRVVAKELLKFPAYAPLLQGFAPYHDLVQAVTGVVADPAAVLEFPYDWRLSVEFNATDLAVKARRHLENWRVHPTYVSMRRDLPDTPPARLVLVAHSMGGLLARALPNDLDVRVTITLGTPLDGAAKAVLLLAKGVGAPLPLPRRKLYEAARTMPGVYDLLPSYRCVDDQSGDTDPRRLTPDDVARFGGSPELADQAFSYHRAMVNRSLPGEHIAVIGIGQPTDASVSLLGQEIKAHRHTFRLRGDVFQRDARGVLVRYREDGDGTVPLNSALPSGFRPTTLAQSHGAIAASDETIRSVCEIIAGRGPTMDRLGGEDLGLDLPDIVPTGSEVTIAINGVAAPNDAFVTIEDADGATIDDPSIHYWAHQWCVTTFFPKPGIYRVALADRSRTSPVVQFTLADEM